MNTSMVKIDFELDPEEWHGQSHEGLWAEPLQGAKSATTFTLKNSPFYAHGISFMDIIEAHPTKQAGRFRFGHVIQKSGHSTYWLIVDKSNGEFHEWWSRLEKLGCTYEYADFDHQRLLYSVDVPERSNINDVYDVVIEGRKNLIWDAAEGDVGHNISREANPPRSQ